MKIKKIIKSMEIIENLLKMYQIHMKLYIHIHKIHQIRQKPNNQ